MKKFLQIIIFLASFNCFGDNWTQKTSVGGTQRNGAVGFSINSLGKCYVGTGGDGTGGFLHDFWEYNPSTNVWIQKADYPGAGGAGLIGFSIGSKGYVGGGGTDTSMAQDFWEYDPSTNNWTQKANLPAGKRMRAISFSIGAKGYMGTGYDSNYSPTADFWEYDPVTDIWTQRANYGGGANVAGVGVSTSTKGYVCMGYPSFNSDFWEYDPVTDIWTQRANVGGPMHADVVGFSICEKVYIGTGETTSSNNYTNQLWEYDPSNNQWLQKANFIGSARDEAVGFSLLNKGYLGTGDFGLTDWYEYTPDNCNNTGLSELLFTEDLIRSYPNPFHDKINFQSFVNEPKELFLYDILSRKLLQQTFTNSTTINTEQLSEGIYIYEVRSKNGTITTGKLIKQ